MTATQLLKAISKANNGLMGAAEIRTFEHSLIKMLFSNQNDVFQDLTTMKKSIEQPTKAILFNRQYVASGTGKTHDHTGAGADTFEKDIAFVQRVQTFQISYKRAANNQFTYQEILNNKLKQAVINLYEDISSYAIAQIAAQRSQVGVDSIIPFDDVTNYQFDNPSASNKFFFDYLKAAMKKNKFRGVMDVVGDQMNAALYRDLARNATQNADNTAFQLPNINFVEEEQMAITANGEAYAWQKGLVGMTSWNEQLNVEGKGAPGDNDGFFTTMKDPILPMTHDVHIINSIQDTTGAAGNPQDSVDEYEISSIITLQGAYESTANASPIFRFTQG